jgi:hypothetical protein
MAFCLEDDPPLISFLTWMLIGMSARMIKNLHRSTMSFSARTFYHGVEFNEINNQLFLVQALSLSTRPWQIQLIKYLATIFALKTWCLSSNSTYYIL